MCMQIWLIYLKFCMYIKKIQNKIMSMYLLTLRLIIQNSNKQFSWNIAYAFGTQIYICKHTHVYMHNIYYIYNATCYSFLFGLHPVWSEFLLAQQSGINLGVSRRNYREYWKSNPTDKSPTSCTLILAPKSILLLFICFHFGPHHAVLSVFSWLCALGILLAGPRKLYVVLDIELRAKLGKL